MGDICKMHIVFVTTELATVKNSSGGLASFTANMARIFSNNGHKVTVLLASVKENDAVFDDDFVVESTYIKKYIWDFFDKIASCLKTFVPAGRDEIRRILVDLYRCRQIKCKLRKISNKEKIDIIHYCNLGATALSSDGNVPYLIRISSFQNICRGANFPSGDIEYSSNPSQMNEKLIEHALKKSRYNVSPSNIVADIARKHLNIEAAVLESPFVLNENDWDYGYYNNFAKGKKYIIHYGRLSYLKGTHIVAALVKAFLNYYPDMHLVLVGDSRDMYDKFGNTIKAHELVKDCAGQYVNRVIYAGRLVREQLYPLIQNAELCILPSRIENLSNACIEAMAMGKIVVATNGASYEQLIEDGVNGFLRERDNPDSFLEGIEEALSLSESEKKAMSENAKKTVERLSPDNIYKQYLAYYQKVIQEW